MNETLEAHPAAELFPLMEGAEFDALVADIKAHGQHDPIIIHEHRILDGRNRYRACAAAGVSPRLAEWNEDGDVIQFVVSKNLHRRHLNESQRGVIAARLAALPLGSNQHDSEGARIQAPSQKEAATLLNVSRSTVQEAKTVLDRGTPEEIAAVLAGTVSASTIGRQIRSGDGAARRKSKRDETLSHTGRNPERIQRAQINAEIWGRIRDALIHLTSLPLSADVVAIARAHDRTGLVDQRLGQSLQWLKEFSHEWSNCTKAEKGNDGDRAADTGDGRRVA